MLESMTGFGSKEKDLAPFGKVGIELKSSNHKFLDIVFHLPDGFLSLENQLKQEIERSVKRGRIICAININGSRNEKIFINRRLLKNYFLALKGVKGQFHLKQDIDLATLINLPGVVSLSEKKISGAYLWPRLKLLVCAALADLLEARQKEGRALSVYLKNRALGLTRHLSAIQKRFRKVRQKKLTQCVSDEERASFLKETDISEELQRLTFHIKNFLKKLLSRGPIGKELDFIAQEMQREANTMAAKCNDALISAWVVQVKSQIEKIREQVQNIE